MPKKPVKDAWNYVRFIRPNTNVSMENKKTDAFRVGGHQCVSINENDVNAFHVKVVRFVSINGNDVTVDSVETRYTKFVYR